MRGPSFTLLVISKVGPPEFPGLIAASIWMIGKRPGLFLRATMQSRKLQMCGVAKFKRRLLQQDTARKKHSFQKYIIYTWIFQVCKICAFSPKRPTKRQKFYISGRSRYIYIYTHYINVSNPKQSYLEDESSADFLKNTLFWDSSMNLVTHQKRTFCSELQCVMCNPF